MFTDKYIPGTTFVRYHFAVAVASTSLSPTILLRCIYTSTVYVYQITCVRNHFGHRPSSPPVPASSLAPRSEKKKSIPVDIHGGVFLFGTYVTTANASTLFRCRRCLLPLLLRAQRKKSSIYTCECIPIIYYARSCPLRSHYRLYFVLRRRRCLVPPLLRTKSRRSFLGM